MAGSTGKVVAWNGTTQCTIEFENPLSDGEDDNCRVRLDSVRVTDERKKRKTRPKNQEQKKDNNKRAKRKYTKQRKGTAKPAADNDSDAEEEVPEQEEPRFVVKEKSEQLARWLAEAKRPVFLLGAGISAPVLPTFRGKNGLWTKNAHKNDKPQDCVAAKPTFTHRAITALEQAGHVYYCCTQNYDDLSRRSGFPANKLVELHGNIFIETCDRCGCQYHRDFEVVLEESENHETGRTCEQEGCAGVLRDNIIHFDEHLGWQELKMANAKFCGADLTVVLGSSLRVEPAASMPFKSKHRHRNPNTDCPKAVIVNLQPTPSDDEADMIIRAQTDDVFEHVAKALGLSVDP